jgi:hypothetical protein
MWSPRRQPGSGSSTSSAFAPQRCQVSVPGQALAEVVARVSDYLSDHERVIRWTALDADGPLTSADRDSDTGRDRLLGAWQSRGQGFESPQLH